MSFRRAPPTAGKATALATVATRDSLVTKLFRGLCIGAPKRTYNDSLPVYRAVDITIKNRTEKHQAKRMLLRTLNFSTPALFGDQNKLYNIICYNTQPADEVHFVFIMSDEKTKEEWQTFLEDYHYGDEKIYKRAYLVSNGDNADKFIKNFTIKQFKYNNTTKFYDMKAIFEDFFAKERLEKAAYMVELLAMDKGIKDEKDRKEAADSLWIFSDKYHYIPDLD